MANEKSLPSNDTLINGQPHDANLIRANDEYLRDTIFVDSSEPLGPNVHRGMIWIDTSVTPHAIKIRLTSSWATVTTVEKFLFGIDSNKGATPDPGDLYIATDTGKIYACFTDDSWEAIYTPTFPSGAYTNILTNGGFEIWQRGAGAFTVNGNYTADMWKLFLNGSATASITRETTTKLSGEYSLKCVWTYTGGGDDCVIRQYIENYKEFQGKTVTFSCYVKSNGAGRIKLGIYDGVGGTVSSYNVGTGWEKLSVTRTIDANATSFRVQSTSDVASDTFYMDEAMLTLGSEVIDYISLPLSEDIERCQRYYELSTDDIYFGLYAGTTNRLSIPIQFSTKKTSTPTVTLSGGTDSAFLSSKGAGEASIGGFNLYMIASAGGNYIRWYNGGIWTAEVT